MERSGTMSGTIRNNEQNNEESIDNIQDLVLNQIRKNKRVSVTQIAKEFKVTRRTIFRIIDTLKSQNRIKRVGDLKSGTWKVID